MKGEILSTLTWIIFAGLGAQWLAWRLRLPSILLLLVVGFLVGPFSALIDPSGERWIDPDRVFGEELLFPIVSLFVGIILFEGGLSLRLREIAETRNVVFRFVTVGVLVTWAVTALAAWAFLGLDVPLSLLFGAILTVTGPTVIGPLLRHIRPAGRVGSILKWEGIVNDAIGALLSVLVFEVILSGIGRTPSVILGGILWTVLVGVGGALAAGWLLVFLLRRYLIPDFLHSPATLAWALLLFGLSNRAQHESGLLAVTVLGVYLANQDRVRIKHIIEFKENLRVLLIAILFILLSARLELTDLRYVDAGAALFLAGLLLVVRPLAVFFSTIRSPLTRRERIFLAWMAPRGIVAAAVASVFALRLGGSLGYEGAERLTPLMFIVIIGTVTIYGLTSGPLARLLRLSFPNPQGVLLVGAHRWARDMALALHNEGFRVLMVDTNWANISASRMAGLPTFYGSALSGYSVDEIPLEGVGKLIALTPNDEVNSLATMHFSEMFGRQEVYQVAVVSSEGRQQDTTVARGRRIFGRDVTFGRLEANFQKGWRIRTVKLTADFDFDGFRALYTEDALPLFVISEGRQLSVFAADHQLKPRSGQTIIAFVPAEVADVSPADIAPVAAGAARGEGEDDSREDGADESRADAEAARAAGQAASDGRD